MIFWPYFRQTTLTLGRTKRNCPYNAVEYVEFNIFGMKMKFL